MAVGACKLRRPVVTPGKCQVVGVEVTDVGRCIERLGLLMPAGLHVGHMGCGEVLHGKEVGQTNGHTVELVVHTVGDGAVYSKCVITHVGDRTTEVCLYAPVGTEGFVETYKEVTENLLVRRLGDTIVTTVRTAGELVVGRSVVLLGVVVIGVVNADTPCKGKVGKHLVAQVGSEHEAVLVVLVEVAVVDPVGVLHGHTVVAHRPVLRVELTLCVVTLIALDVVPVVATGEQERTHHRVAIGTLVDHVAVGLLDVGSVHVKGHLVVEERGCVAHVEVVTVVTVVGNNTFGVNGCNRSISLVLVGTGREGHGLGRKETGLQVIVGIVIAVVVERGQRRTPGHVAGGDICTAGTCAVTALDAVGDQCAVPGERAVVGHLGLAGLALLGGDDDGTVGSFRTIEGGSGSTGKHRHRFDVLGVEVGDRLGRALRTELGRTAGVGSAHRHAVNNIKGVRRLHNRLGTTHHNLRDTTHTRRRGVDVHTGNLTGKAVDEVGILVL